MEKIKEKFFVPKLVARNRNPKFIDSQSLVKNNSAKDLDRQATEYVTESGLRKNSITNTVSKESLNSHRSMRHNN